jgi:hypothetical protein
MMKILHIHVTLHVSTAGHVTVTSSEVTLSIPALTPVITVNTQPADQSATRGVASFSVAASVTEGVSLSYQWQKSIDGGSNYANIEGQTSALLALANLDVHSNDNKYRVVVSAPWGAQSVISHAAKLSVKPIISIKTQPADQVVLVSLTNSQVAITNFSV